MDNVTALDKLVRSLSFEVQAVPQDNIVQVTTTSKSAPLNVKIRVRKKEEAGLHHGVITLPPSTSHPHSSPEIIRLVSSDQTIMSFNMIMEADFGKPKKKTRKNILGIFKPACFGGQSDEDDHEGEINEECITQSDGALKRKTLKKNRDERTSDFFGKCKPGGCLDPPFGEDTEPYSPANEEEHTVDDRVMMNAPMQSAENKPRSSSIFSNKILSWKRKKSNDEALDKDDEVKRAKNESVIDLYQSGSLRTSTTYSNSVMTYPVNSSELRMQENKLRLSDIYIDPSKNSFNENSGPFFVPSIVPGAPKKRTEEENNAAKKTDKDGKPIEDYQRPQGLGIGGTEKQPRSKDSGTDFRELSTDLRQDICHKTDSDSASKTNIENRTIIPVIIPLQKLEASAPPLTSSIKAERETQDTEVLVTSSDISLDTGFEKKKLFAVQNVDESNNEALLLDAQQNTNNNNQAKILLNKKQFPEDVEAEKSPERQINDDCIEHISAPEQFDISQKNYTETTITKDFENDLDFKYAPATVKTPKEADSQFITEVDEIQTDMGGPEDLSTKISTNKDFTEPVVKSEFGIDSNTEEKKVIKPEINQKPEELALDYGTSKKDDILMPDTPANELGFKSLSKDAEKLPKVKPDEKSVVTLGSDRQLSAYNLTNPDIYITRTGNDDPGIPTPITRDTPLELEVDELQQLWKNDADSLESVPVTLHINKNMLGENINLLDKVSETIDETSKIFVSKNNVNDIYALNDLKLENYDENIISSGIENTENIGQYDSNGLEESTYPRKETKILELTPSDVGNKDILTKPENNLLGDPLEMTNVQQYGAKTIVGENMIEVPVYEKDIVEGVQKYDENIDRTSNVQQKSGDGTPTDQMRDPVKPDEKHIQFIDDIDAEKTYDDAVVSPSESGYFKNSKGLNQRIDIKTAESEKVDVTIDGFETKYPYRSISGAQSPEADFPKSFQINLGIQSYTENDKVIVKSFDSNTEPQRYPNDIVKVVKCDLKVGNEILVPINSDNDLVVEIKSNKPKTRIIGAVGRLNTGTMEKDRLGTEFEISPVNRNLVIIDDIRKTLLAVYEEELLPLRKSISELKSNMEVFTSRQVVPKGRNMFEQRSRPSKIVPPLFKRCGCIRR